MYNELKAEKDRLKKLLSHYKDMKGTKNYREIERRLEEVSGRIRNHFAQKYKDNGK